MGGIDQRDMAMATFLQNEYDRFAGNLQAMGGLGAQASTVGQEEIISGNVARNVADMRMAVVSFASECVLDLGRLMWEDQTLELQTSIPVGNIGIEVSSNWMPDYRQGVFEDYEFRVEPYSMVFKTPEQHLQELFQVLRELAPLWPMFQASGATFDAEAIVDEIARLKNRPEFRKFIIFTDPMGALGGDENTVRQAANTTRTNVRKNIPTGGTEQARSNAMIQTLMGGKPQVNSQQSAMLQRGPA
jgi:hypothetical protein